MTNTNSIPKSQYQFYMQQVTAKGEWVLGTKKNLEVDFDGLRYKQAKGINNIGKARIYTEKYADSDRMRVYVPKEVTNDPTTVTFTFYFFGANRQATFDAFNGYIRNGIHRYWDTARNKYFDFVVEESIQISEEKWYESTPYFSVDYKVQNLNGKTFDVKDLEFE